MTRKKFYTPDAGTEQMLSHIHYCKNFSKKIQCTKYVQNKPKKKKLSILIVQMIQSKDLSIGDVSKLV